MESEKKDTTKRLNIYHLFIGITVLLGVILIINILLTFGLFNDLKKDAEAVKEKLRPAKIELTLIRDSKCIECFDVSEVVSYVKSANVNITKEKILEFDSKDGTQIISKYKIEKVPTVIVTGEIDKFSVQGFTKKEDSLVLALVQPPFTNATTGQIEGRVMLYNLKDFECEKCNDLSAIISQIKGAGINIYQEKNIAYSSDEGKELIKKYNIGFVPTIILSKDAGAYDIIKQGWPQIGSKEIDGSYVLRLVAPPFINLTTSKLMGVVNIVYLTDESCKECYDVDLHRQILVSPQGFAVKLDREEKIDIGDVKGKEIVSKYNITKIPTIILSDDVSIYPSYQALKQFFSVEKDGSYVFRRVQVVGTYKDLITNQVVQVQQQQN